MMRIESLKMTPTFPSSVGFARKPGRHCKMKNANCKLKNEEASLRAILPFAIFTLHFFSFSRTVFS